jgi:hypothetical protein
MVLVSTNQRRSLASQWHLLICGSMLA